jgi:gliding motility-associated-like protein
VVVDAPNDDECDDCDFIFFTDTVYVELAGNSTEICLPTTLSVTQFSNFALALDGSAYNEIIEECDENAVFYPYSVLDGYSPYSFRMDEWTIGGNSPMSFEFSSLVELVANMNLIDPTGNWVIDTTSMVIFGGNPNTQYGTMAFTHIPSGSILSYDPGSSQVFTPSIFVNDDREHMLIAVDPNNPDCADTLIINLLDGNMPTNDTIYITVEVGETQDTCLDVSELGTLESISNECISLTNNAQWLANGNECISVEGLSEGPDEFCMVLCDNNGLCDTTYVIVNVIDGSTEIDIATGFSPNGDGVNDYFKIDNIEHHPNNDIAVFNRWGNQVYQRDRYDNSNPWRGEYEGQILPDGTYFYLLDVEVDGQMKSYKGYVQIRR